MKGAYVFGLFVLFVLLGCASEGFRGDTPATTLTRPVADIKAGKQKGNIICVIESNDPENRPCASVVHNAEGDAKGKAI
jgi:hypothetical protein